MHSVTTVEALQKRLDDWSRSGERVALVPTMGNLHEGHLSLVGIARHHAQRVVATIFVNPSQFGEGEDFADYPRTLERDKRHLSDAGVDLLFNPDVKTVYPFGVAAATVVSVPELTAELCGRSRPGHFDGVTSVVLRLFNFVQPDFAVFGQKDYQQLQVVRRMVADLGLPVKILQGPTQRHSDGLAMSSRNNYLSEDQRNIAPGLHATLLRTGQQIAAGSHDFAQLARQGSEELAKLGFRPDYFDIRSAVTLRPPAEGDDKIVVLAAAWLGNTRLIDNLVIAV